MEGIAIILLKVVTSYLATYTLVPSPGSLNNVYVLLRKWLLTGFLSFKINTIRKLYIFYFPEGICLDTYVFVRGGVSFHP